MGLIITMINVNIVSGFLGSGKTTFLRKIIHTMQGQTVLIENEFSEAGLDGEIIGRDIPTREIYSGCICCNLSGDFTEAIGDLISNYKPNNIMVEPSGVANITDIVKSFDRTSRELNVDIKLNYLINIVDLTAFKDYIENFGIFYRDQIKNSKVILFSHFNKVDKQEMDSIIKKIKDINDSLIIIKEDWHSISGEKVIELLEKIKEYDIDLDEVLELESTNIEFSSYAINSPKQFHIDKLQDIPTFLKDVGLGTIYRAKGILSVGTNEYIYFDYTPNHYKTECLKGNRDPKVAIIGNDLNEKKLSSYFTDEEVL